MISRRPTARHSPAFSAAERPVCVPYKRKGTTPDRLNCRAAAPAASATVNVKTVTIRAFDKYALHGLKKIYTNPIRMIPKKVGSKSARRERVYKRAAETRRDFFRRGGARQAGGCHALLRGT